MRLGHSAVVALTALALICGAARPAAAQGILLLTEPPADPPVRLGPVTIAPAIRLASIGHDSNVFNRDKSNNPEGDFLAFASPTAEAWMRLSHARVNARGQFDFYYFRTLPDLSAVDMDTSARIELPLNRLKPFVAGSLLNTRHRQNLEIDAIAKRRNDEVRAGAELRLTPKVSVLAYALRSGVEYEPDAEFRGTDLAQSLNVSSTGEAVGVRHAWTPFTTFSVEVERRRDRFEFGTVRDADTLTVAPTVEFNPLALVSGRATVGYQKRKNLSGVVPDWSGTFVFVNLAYAFRARTQLAVSARRSLEYSYVVGRADYWISDITPTITQRFGDSWDVIGFFGRAHLSYREVSVPTSEISIPVYPDETILSSGLDLGYNIRTTRVGFKAEYRTRQNNVQALDRGYERLRIGPTVTHRF